jgi:hypothetical protein
MEEANLFIGVIALFVSILAYIKAQKAEKQQERITRAQLSPSLKVDEEQNKAVFFNVGARPPYPDQEVEVYIRNFGERTRIESIQVGQGSEGSIRFRKTPYILEKNTLLPLNIKRPFRLAEIIYSDMVGNWYAIPLTGSEEFIINLGEVKDVNG